MPDFLAQQRDRARAAAVGERGEEPEKEPNPDHRPARVEAAQPDRVHVRGAVDRRPKVRFGDDQKLAAAHETLHVGRQLRQVAQPAEYRVVGVAQNSQRRPRRFGGTFEDVFAVAEKGEVVVVEPAQKILGFRELRPGHARRRCSGQLIADLAEHLPHRLPIRHRRAHVGEGAGQALRQAGEIGRVRLSGDGDLHPGFALPGCFGTAHFQQLAVGVANDRQDRVDDESDHPVAGIDRPGHGIDEERHVVVDDLDDGMRRRPAVDSRVGVVDADLGPAGPAAAGQVPQRQCTGAQVAGASAGEVHRRNVLIEFGDEGLGLWPVSGILDLGRERRRLLDQPCLLFFGGARHPDPRPSQAAHLLRGTFGGREHSPQHRAGARCLARRQAWKIGPASAMIGRARGRPACASM